MKNQKKSFPIIDFHCDLLSYLRENESVNANDPNSNCSLSQLKKGKIFIETFTIFTPTRKGSSIEALKQINVLKTILKRWSNHIL